MGECTHCGGRGWGVRRGYVRRCELCERFPNEDAARRAAEPVLARFALRERPVAIPSAPGIICCPWCSHVPTNEHEDVFTKLDAEEVYARAIFKVDPRGRAEVYVGPDQTAAVNHADSFFLCPACFRTFEVPDELTHHFDRP